ncbi:MAG: sulfatase [Actinobacteria bacterium]|nr:sulfatase [Actinomycetota bacterium]
MARGPGLTRRRALQTGAAGAAALGLSACGEEYQTTIGKAKDAPNVLLIITDSTRADYVGAYNPQTRARTANLDALAKSGTLFDYSVSGAMPTGLTRREILTGMRGFPCRDWVLSPPLPAEVGWTSILPHQPLLTEVLGQAGVATAYVTDNPFLIGPRYIDFRRTLDIARPDFSQGAYRALNTPFRRPAPRSAIEKYLLPALSNTLEVDRLESHVGWASLYRVGERNYSAARVMRGGMDALEELKDKQPFFLGVDSFDPHEPFDAPPVYVNIEERGRKLGIQRTRGILPIQPFLTPASTLKSVDIDPETLELVRDLYAAELSYTDVWIGKLLNKLEDLGLADNTVVYYLSDHGITLGEHGIIGKSTPRPYPEIHHVPYMIRDPSKRLAGTRNEYFASSYDVARTILSYFGVRAPGLMSGEDLTVLFDGKQPPARPYYTACYQETWIAGDREWVMISNTEGSRRELYHLPDDPDANHDVSADHTDVTDKLWAVLTDEAGGTLPEFKKHIGVVGG